MPRLGRARELVLGLCLLSSSCQRRDEAAQARHALASLPYLAEVPVKPEHAHKAGVVLHDAASAVPGLNLYTSKRWTEARLVDMEGRVVHVVRGEPSPPLSATIAPRIQEVLGGWMHVELGPSGNLFVIEEMRAVSQRDLSGKRSWTAEIPAHHDLAPTPDGRVFVLSATPRRLTVGGRAETFLDNVIVELSPKGRVRSRRSLLDLLAAHPETTQLLNAALAKRAGWSSEVNEGTLSLGSALERQQALPDLQAYLAGKPMPERLACMLLYLTPADVLHTNTLELLPRDVPLLGRKGDFLLSVRNLDLVLVISATTSQVSWHFGPGELEEQHQPSLLPNGHVLVFDNGVRSRRSRVLEIDPADNRIVWRYEGAAQGKSAFFTPFMGGAQGLDGGNVLITDSTSSRAFEVNRAGAIVWDYFDPSMIAEKPAEAARAARERRTLTLYRVARIPFDALPNVRAP